MKGTDAGSLCSRLQIHGPVGMKYNPAIEGYELLTLMTEEELAKAPSFGTDKEFDWGNRVREVDAYWIGF